MRRPDAVAFAFMLFGSKHAQAHDDVNIIYKR